MAFVFIMKRGITEVKVKWLSNQNNLHSHEL